MDTLYNRFNLVFYVLFIYAFILFILPTNLTFGTYTFNFLGWSMIAAIILSFLIFLLLLIMDLNRNKPKKKLINRTAFLITILLVSSVYWFYIANK